MIDVKIEKLKPTDFIPSRGGKETDVLGIPLELDGELTFEEDVDPESGQQFLATVKVVDGIPHLVDIEGISVLGVAKVTKKDKPKAKKAEQEDVDDEGENEDTE
ncbi:MAG: hypothetical protein NZL93_04355 [Chthoniobacterales bacterium]|nr:hypothetical protein [Chthoniobacterales bacterium]